MILLKRRRYSKRLGSKNGDVRRQAAVALGHLGDKRVVELLIKALSDESFSVRQEAAVALGRLGDKRAVEPLIKAISDKNDLVVIAVADALQKLESAESNIWVYTHAEEHRKRALTKMQQDAKERYRETYRKERLNKMRDDSHEGLTSVPGCSTCLGMNCD